MLVSSLASEVFKLLLWLQEHVASDVLLLLSLDNALKSEASACSKGAPPSTPSQALFSVLLLSVGSTSPVVLTAGVLSGKEEAVAPSGVSYASDVPNINAVIWL